MTPLGSSAGGEVFYVSSEEWRSQAAQAAQAATGPAVMTQRQVGCKGGQQIAGNEVGRQLMAFGIPPSKTCFFSGMQRQCDSDKVYITKGQCLVDTRQSRIIAGADFPLWSWWIACGFSMIFKEPCKT